MNIRSFLCFEAFPVPCGLRPRHEAELCPRFLPPSRTTSTTLPTPFRLGPILLHFSGLSNKTALFHLCASPTLETKLHEEGTFAHHSAWWGSSRTKQLLKKDLSQNMVAEFTIPVSAGSAPPSWVVQISLRTGSVF